MIKKSVVYLWYIHLNIEYFLLITSLAQSCLYVTLCVKNAAFCSLFVNYKEFLLRNKVFFSRKRISLYILIVYAVKLSL